MYAQRAPFTISLTLTLSYSAYKEDHSSFSSLQHVQVQKPYVRNGMI
jgi:hypothetical protein